MNVLSDRKVTVVREQDVTLGVYAAEAELAMVSPARTTSVGQGRPGGIVRQYVCGCLHRDTFSSAVMLGTWLARRGSPKHHPVYTPGAP